MSNRIAANKSVDTGQSSHQPTRCRLPEIPLTDVVQACRDVFSAHERCQALEDLAFDEDGNQIVEYYAAYQAATALRRDALTRVNIHLSADANDTRAKLELLVALETAFSRNDPTLGLIALSVAREALCILTTEPEQAEAVPHYPLGVPQTGTRGWLPLLSRVRFHL